MTTHIEKIADQVLAKRAPLPTACPGDEPDEAAWMYEVIALADDPGPLQARANDLRHDSTLFLHFCNRERYVDSAALREVAWRRFERPTIAAVRISQQSAKTNRIGEDRAALDQARAAIDACVAFYRASILALY